LFCSVAAILARGTKAPGKAGALRVSVPPERVTVPLPAARLLPLAAKEAGPLPWV